MTDAEVRSSCLFLLWVNPSLYSKQAVTRLLGHKGFIYTWWPQFVGSGQTYFQKASVKAPQNQR